MPRSEPSPLWCRQNQLLRQASDMRSVLFERQRTQIRDAGGALTRPVSAAASILLPELHAEQNTWLYRHFRDAAHSAP